MDKHLHVHAVFGKMFLGKSALLAEKIVLSLVSAHNQMKQDAARG